MKCNYFQDEKLEYEEIEDPDELLFMVRQTVAADRRKKAAGRRMRVLKAVGSVAAVLFLCLTIGVNSSYAFAEAAVKIPIVKSVAKAVVIRSYRPEILAVYEENKVSNPSEKTPVQQEDQPAMSGEMVSGNDAPIEEEETEMPAQTEPTGQEAEPEQALTGIDAWKTEMTVEKLKEVTVIYTPEMEKKYADTPEKLRTILLAQLPGKDIALYGYHEGGSLAGVILLAGDECQYFDWNYMKENGKLPELTCADIDGDGTEEIMVSLYNRTDQKRELSGETAKEAQEKSSKESVKEISKESIPAPGEELKTETDKTEDTLSEKDKEIFSDGSTGGKIEEALPSVSGNDVMLPTESEEEAEEFPGELWVVTPQGDIWEASVLSVDDYESQILHQIKATYEPRTGKIRLYIGEEPFGISMTGPVGLTYETIDLAPNRNFMIKEGIFLQFQMEVSLLKEDGEKVRVLLEPELEAEIHLEDNSLILESIQEL